MSARSSAKKWLNGDGRFVDGDEEGMQIAFIAGYTEGKLAAQQLAEADIAGRRDATCLCCAERGRDCQPGCGCFDPKNLRDGEEIAADSDAA